MKASIIIRTKNEERWLGHCLAMVRRQTVQDFEVIVVDNESTDDTVRIAQRQGVDRLISVTPFYPGQALNTGIRQSTGEYIVCLSAHCVPRDERWLENLLGGFIADDVAGVYGRQLPVAFSSDADKRDLLITFGLDRRIQVKDTFFHNANSALRRRVWDAFPFDETATNIEDRIWAQHVIANKYRLVYEPEAAVYHHHGIHQNNNQQRVKSVVSVLEQIAPEQTGSLPESLRPEHSEVVALVPVAGQLKGELGFQLLDRLFEQLQEAEYIKKIYLITSDPAATALARHHQVTVVTRPETLDDPATSVENVLQWGLTAVEGAGVYPEIVVYANYLSPFRPAGLFDTLVGDMQYKGLDTAFTGLIDFGNYWLSKDNSFIQVGDGLKPREQKEPLYRALYGVGSAVRASVIRRGSLIGDKVGIMPVTDELYATRYSDERSAELITWLLQKSPQPAVEPQHERAPVA